MTPEFAISVIWVAWVLSWIAASAWTKPTLKRAGLGRELLYRIMMFAGMALMVGAPIHRFEFVRRMWQPLTGPAGWAMAALVAAGALFAWWARLHLGSLWSSNVTRKNEHRVVSTGPYAVVRHPIYTGLILALLATAIAHGSPTTFLGGALMAAGIVLKAKLEERFLREELGPQGYDAYAKRVPMLVPFWPF